MNIYGGNVRIDGTVLSVDLSWTNFSDSFYAKDISYGVEIAEDKTFYDEDGNAYSGTIDSDATTETSPIGGKTLRPLTNVLVLNDDADNTAAISGSTGQRNVILQGRKLWKDGAWNTLCLPFDVDLTDEEGTLYGATVMKLNPETSGLSGTTLTLNFDDAPETISAGTWYDLQGRRLDAQPTKAGVYIHGGCKVVVP